MTIESNIEISGATEKPASAFRRAARMIAFKAEIVSRTLRYRTRRTLSAAFDILAFRLGIDFYADKKIEIRKGKLATDASQARIEKVQEDIEGMYREWNGWIAAQNSADPRIIKLGEEYADLKKTTEAHIALVAERREDAERRLAKSMNTQNLLYNPDSRFPAHAGLKVLAINYDFLAHNMVRLARFIEDTLSENTGIRPLHAGKVVDGLHRPATQADFDQMHARYGHL